MNRIMYLAGRGFLHAAKVFVPVLVFISGFYIGLAGTFMAGQLYRSQCLFYKDTFRYAESLLVNRKYDALVGSIDDFCRSIESGEAHKTYAIWDKILELNKSMKDAIIDDEE